KHGRFHGPDRKGRGVPEPGKPHDVSLRAVARRARRSAFARRLFRRRRRLAVRARSGRKGISQRARRSGGIASSKKYYSLLTIRYSLFAALRRLFLGADQLAVDQAFGDLDRVQRGALA